MGGTIQSREGAGQEVLGRIRKAEEVINSQ